MFAPKFVISNKILKNIGLIEAAREMINNAPLVPAWEAQFKQDAVVRTVHFGTHVEGNDLTLEQTEKVVRHDPEKHETAAEVGEKVGVSARERDIQEVINYRNVLRYIDQLVSGSARGQDFLYTKEQVLKMHALSVKRVMPANQIGVLRAEQVVIRGVTQGEVVHRPPNAIEVPYQIEDFFVWINSSEARGLHSVIKAAITHYELSRIHPFTEGNGRTSRAVVLLILAVEGIDARRFFSMEEHFDKNVKEYYKAFVEVASAGGDMTSWVEFFSYALAVEMGKVKEKVKRLSMDARLKGKMGRQVALKERQIVLIEYLETHEWMTMAEARELLSMVSDDTILRDIKDLMQKNLIVKRGKTKGAKYGLKGMR